MKNLVDALARKMSGYIPKDNLSYRFPVSMKGVIIKESQIILLKNERNEWELPGGKLEPGEVPEECLRREIREELNVDVEVGNILDSWVYQISQEVLVVIITYGCYLKDGSNLACSWEHKELGMFPEESIAGLTMPDGYKKSIRRWLETIHD